jgi:hypothetical protein
MTAFAAIWGLYEFTANRIIEFDTGFINLVLFSNVSFPIFIMFAAIGFGVGVGGSGLALNRYLKV